MGTRNLTVVISDGKFKVAQYGQWDGYPSGQGKTVLEFLKTVDLDAFKKKLKKVSFLTKKELAKIDKETGGGVWHKVGELTLWDTKYPYLSRDMCAKILEFIMTGLAVVRNPDYSNPKLYDRTLTVKPEFKDGKIKLVNSIDFGEDGTWCEWCYVINLDKNTLTVCDGPLSSVKKVYYLDDLPTVEKMMKDCDSTI